MAAADLQLDGLCVPLPATWYGNATAVCTPNRGLAYVAVPRHRFVYIPPKQDGCVADIVTIQPPYPIKSIDCDPDWSQTQHIVTMDMENILAVWDMRQQLITVSCRVHNPNFVRPSGRRPKRSMDHRLVAVDGTMCVLRTRRVLSNVNNCFSLWCTVSNTYTTFGVDPLFERDHIVLMRGSPYDDQLVAIGTQRGLVAIVDLSAKRIVHKLRGHDKCISSLDWMEVTAVVAATALSPAAAVPTVAGQRPQLKASTAASAAQEAAEAKLRGKLVPIVESDDVFDIYDFNDAADKFGVVSQPTFATAAQHEAELERLRMLSVEEKAVGNDHFDFVEACQSLKEEILQTNEAEKRPDSEDSITSDFEKLGLSPEVPSNVDGMRVSVMVNSSDESFMNVVVQDLVEKAALEGAEGEKPADVPTIDGAEQTVPELETNTIDQAEQKLPTTRKVIYLASGAGEPVVWIWNTQSGVATQKIELKRAGKNGPIPSMQTTMCWMDEQTMLVNSPVGEVVSYHVQAFEDKLTINPHANQPYVQHLVTGLTKCTAAPGLPFFWSRSVGNELICCTTGEPQPTVLQHFCTAVMPQMAIRESPHDPTVVALAGNGRRINLMNLSSLRTDHIRLTGYTNRMQAKVLYLSWHPEHENQLAFSTEEGRVGIYDVNKPSNVPNVVNPFTSSPVYQMAWARVNTSCGAADAARWVLFACAKGKLVYIPENQGQKALHAVTVLEEGDIMSVGACADYLAFGTGDGYVIVFRPHVDNHILTTKLWNRKLSTRYISECTFSTVQTSRLAVATSNHGIHVFDCCGDGEPVLVNELLGHEGVTMAKWSAEQPERLVSSGFDGTVRVWNVMTGQCTALMQFSSVMCSALFMPTDENYVLAVGLSEMVRMFDVRVHANGKPTEGGMKAVTKKNAVYYSENHNQARPVQTDATVLAALERKRNKRSGGGAAKRAQESRAQELGNANSSYSSPEQPLLKQRLAQHVIREIVDEEDSDVAVIHEPVQLCCNGNSHRSSDSERRLLPLDVADVKSFNYTTICHQSSKEFNRDVITLLQQLIAGEQPAERRQLNHLLFGSRNDVRDLLQIELKNHRFSQTESIAHVLIPQLCDQLEADITARIAHNTLTERHLAMAPMISYKFWSDCCKAYFKQMLELGAPLQALPYLMAQQEIDEAITVLCKSHYYREAWIVAKMHRESGDKVFAPIVEQWIAQLVSKGFLDGAAFVAASVGDHAQALKLLQSHHSKSPEVDQLIEKIQSTVA